MDSAPRTLTIIGEVNRPLALHFDDLRRLPAVERTVQIVCSSGQIRDVVMRGVALARMFALAKARGVARMAVFTCSDGHQERVPLADLIQQEAFLAYWLDGGEEEEQDSLPRLSIPGKVGSKWAKGVHTIELC